MSQDRNIPPFPSVIPSRYQPSAEEVDHLISRAEQHPLGLEFLQQGALDAVSATFKTHAFVVDDARARLVRR
jgi:hypothetical protein